MRLRIPLGIVVLLVATAASIHYLRTGPHAAQAKPAARRADAGTNNIRFFDVNCTLAVTANDDPLKYPSEPGASHKHYVFGNTSFSAYSSEDSLLAANAGGTATTCGPTGQRTAGDKTCNAYDLMGLCPAYRELDGSDYWQPAVIRCRTDPGAAGPLDDATFAQFGCEWLTPDGPNHNYYFARQPFTTDPSSPNYVHAMPPGFGEIQGSLKTDNSGQLCDVNDPSSCSHEWRCLDDPQNGVTYTNIDNNSVQGGDGTGGFVCNDTSDPANGKSIIRLTVHMAECWDGVDLFKPDESHVAFAINKQCPDSYPVLLPANEEQVDYTVQTGGVGWFYRLACTPTEMCSTETGHGDVFSAWHIEFEQQLVDSCLNAAVSGTQPGCNTTLRGS